LRIASVETLLARLPLQCEPWGDSFHRVTHIEILVCDVTTDTGLVGTGFSHTSGVGGLTLKSLVDRDLAPLVIGREVAPRPLWHDGWHHVRDLGAGGFTTTALAAIDIALWDLVAKEARKPLTHVLGGKCRERVLTYASGINLNKSVDELTSSA
jgi:L-alanine-DL-glutamate epimerase-like enolase superfamily enzyme